MGFSTTLGMYNLRMFLFKLSEALKEQGIGGKDGIAVGADHHNLKGFGPQTREFTISKDNKVLIGIDAGDDEGYSAWGEDQLDGFADAKEAIDKENMEAAIAAIQVLIK